VVDTNTSARDEGCNDNHKSDEELTTLVGLAVVEVGIVLLVVGAINGTAAGGEASVTAAARARHVRRNQHSCCGGGSEKRARAVQADDDDDDAIIEQWLRTAMPALVRSTETSPHRRALIHREKACAGERKPEGCGCGGVAACAAGARATEER